MLSGIIQSDETYIQDNYKGNYLAAKNLEKPVDTERLPAYEENRMSGYCHNRGKTTHTRGLSKQKVCVPCAIDDQGRALAKAAGKGMVQLNFLDYALSANLTSTVVLVTDKTPASLKFCEIHEFPLIQLKADSESRNGKVYNLQKINNLHGRLKKLLTSFKGVSTKYLDNYLAWNGFDIRFTGLNKLEIQDKLSLAMSSIGECSTYNEVFGKPPLPFQRAG